MESRFYVYVHSSKDGSVAYVGKGCGGRAYVYQQRSKKWREVFSVSNKPKVSFIKKDLDEEAAFELEMETIISLRVSGVRVLNVELDRRGSAAHWTKEIREKYAEYRKRPDVLEKYRKCAKVKPWRDNEERMAKHLEQMSRPRPKEWGEAISRGKKGITTRSGYKHSEEHKAKIAAAATGRVMSREAVEKRAATIAAKGGLIHPNRRKKVLCIDTEKVYACAKDAALDMGLCEKKIQSVCSGKRGRHGGFHFMYVKENGG